MLSSGRNESEVKLSWGHDVDRKGKRRISKPVLQENKASQIFRKNEHFLPTDRHTHVCESGGKICLLFGKFDVLCFLVTPVLRLANVPYYQRWLLSLARIDEICLRKFNLANLELQFSKIIFSNVHPQSFMNEKSGKSFIREINVTGFGSRKMLSPW